MVVPFADRCRTEPSWLAGPTCRALSVALLPIDVSLLTTEPSRLLERIHVNYRVGHPSGSPGRIGISAPVNRPPRSTALLSAPIMGTLMLNNSSGISAAVTLRHEVLPLARDSAPFVLLLTGRWAEPIPSGTRMNRPTL
jgi:hypothetical protein